MRHIAVIAPTFVLATFAASPAAAQAGMEPYPYVPTGYSFVQEWKGVGCDLRGPVYLDYWGGITTGPLGCVTAEYRAYARPVEPDASGAPQWQWWTTGLVTSHTRFPLSYWYVGFNGPGPLWCDDDANGKQITYSGTMIGSAGCAQSRFSAIGLSPDEVRANPGTISGGAWGRYSFPDYDPRWGDLSQCSIMDVCNKSEFQVGVRLSAVPEPSTWALLGTGLLALGGVAAQRRKRTG